MNAYFDIIWEEIASEIPIMVREAYWNQSWDLAGSEHERRFFTGLYNDVVIIETEVEQETGQGVFQWMTGDRP